MKRWCFFIDVNVIALKSIPNNIHGACVVLACFSHNTFCTGSTRCINTNVFLIIISDIGSVPFDNDVMSIFGKA